VWALGCVLYELCTLKHAFSADNLLGLVYKIVQDKYEPIPSSYSKELNNLINALLNKNASERPSVA
jgi:NIMA (never in mitosis gene a)-related kinase